MQINSILNLLSLFRYCSYNTEARVNVSGVFIPDIITILFTFSLGNFVVADVVGMVILILFLR